MSQDEFRMPDTEQQPGKATSELDLYNEATRSTVDEETLNGNNLGLGNYSRSMYWQQADSFKDGLFTDRAFSRKIRMRAVHSAKRQMAVNGHPFWNKYAEDVENFRGWENLDPEKRKEIWKEHTDDETLTRRRWVEFFGDYIWEILDEEQRNEALRDLAGYEGDWKAPQWRMMLIRHEGSRSIGAHLLDNIFGRVSEVKDETAEMARERLNR